MIHRASEESIEIIALTDPDKVAISAPTINVFGETP
jgi:hypothetical protein